METYPGHSTVNHKVAAVDKAALVAGQEDDRVRLLDGLAESARGEVHLATEALGLVVAEPVLQKGSAALISHHITKQTQGRGTSTAPDTAH